MAGWSVMIQTPLSRVESEQITNILRRLKAADEAVARIRELHTDCKCGESEHARHCVECEQLHPCSTIRALGGDDE